MAIWKNYDRAYGARRLALCEVDARNVRKALRRLHEHYPNSAAIAYLRRVLAFSIPMKVAGTIWGHG
jgi:hypothetical protein